MSSHQVGNVTASERGNVTLNSDLDFYQLIFIIIIILLLSVCSLKCFCFIKATLHAATTLHNNLLTKVRAGSRFRSRPRSRSKFRLYDQLSGCCFPQILGSPMSFFDQTPIGRILSCVSRYQDELDSLLPQHLNALIIFCLLAISACIVNSIIFPVMLLPVLLLILLFILLLW